MSFYDIAEKALMLEKKGKEVIRLNVGDTNIPVPDCAIDAAIKSIENTKASYGSSAGMEELRVRIAENEGCSAENIVIGPGSKHLIYGLLSILASDGESVSLPTPTWPAYGMICKQLGLRLVEIKTEMENRWNFDCGDNNAKITIICNPSNPTSTSYPEETINACIEKAEENDGYLILDEAYKDLAFEKISSYPNAIRVRSFSKEFNLVNWRLGYVVVPEEIAKKLIKFNQITITCVPEFIQKAGIECIKRKEELLKNNRELWKKRSRAAQKALKSHGFAFAKPDAGIYIFPSHESIENASTYAMKLLDNGVAIAPGEFFGGYNRHFRICVNKKEELLEKAIGIMAESIE